MCVSCIDTDHVAQWVTIDTDLLELFENSEWIRMFMNHSITYLNASIAAVHWADDDSLVLVASLEHLR